MTRTLALLILMPCLLWYWTFWGCIFIVSTICHSLCIVTLWLARTAAGRPEPFGSLWRSNWTGSYPTFAWEIFKNPLNL